MVPTCEPPRYTITGTPAGTPGVLGSDSEDSHIPHIPLYRFQIAGRMCHMHGCTLPGGDKCYLQYSSRNLSVCTKFSTQVPSMKQQEK